MASYAQVAISPLILDRVIAKLALSSSSSDLADTVIASAPADTVIMDISATGAQVYRPSKVLPKGAVADMFFLQPDTQRKLHAVGQVVRTTEDGFAVHFLRVERELETLVLNAANDEDGEPGADEG